MKYILFFLLSLSTVAAQAQITPENLALLKKYEDTLATMSKAMIQSENFETRYLMAYNLIPKLKNALKIEGSYHYPFDSVRAISITYPEKEEFRIFTWGLEFSNGLYRHFGAIQMKTKKGLELYPLLDASIYIENPDTIVTNEYWYGANYYNILTRKHKGTKYYYLFGIDGNDKLSTKKLIDVMHFGKEGPVFGAPNFNFTDSLGTDSMANRFIIEYNKTAGVSLNYYPDYGRIIFDHVIPKNPLAIGVYSTYIPDGTYEAFEYNKKKGYWQHIEKAWEGGINEMDNPPVPQPVDFKEEKQRNNYEKPAQKKQEK